MTRSLLSIALLLACPAAFSQDAEALAKQRANLPDAIRKIADVSGDAVSKVKSAATAASKSASPKKDAGTDPSKWNKEETHKLAVMDVEFGGGVETIIFELLPSAAPKTVANFTENCSAGAYKGLAFHRAISGYLVQTGDPYTSDDSRRSEWGLGGEDKKVAGEFKLTHKVGAVAMARRGDGVNPDRLSNGYQFYFALGNMSNLDGAYTVFGQVVSGLDVLQSISHVPVDSNDCPLSRVQVKGIRVVDQKGPLVVMKDTGSGRRHYTKPSAAKGTLTRFLEKIW